MNISTTYLLNAALHAAVLSVFASLALLALRQARHRSVVAIAGLLAVGFLPWLTALRPAQPVTAPVAEIQTQETPALPTWTVVTLPAQQNAISNPAGSAAAPAEFVLPDPFTTFSVIWATGAGVGLLLLAVASLKVHLWRKSLLSLDDIGWQTLQSLTPEIPARSQLLISGTTASPCVTGLFRPRIVLPGFLLEHGSQTGLRWAVRHEIAHWQAGDSRWMIVFALIRCTNWWNPLVHKLVSRWADAREQLCDLHATGVSENRADYGEFLIAMAGKLTTRPPLTVAMAKRPHAVRLKRRIVSLLSATENTGSPVGKNFIAANAVVFIVGAAMISSVKINAGETANEPATIPKSTAIEEPVEAKPSDGTATVTEIPQQPAAAVPDQPAPPAVEGRPVRQLKISNKLLMTAAQPTPKNGAVLTAPALQFYFRTLAATKGVDLMTAPSLTALFGQTATLEIIREVLGTPKQIAARDPKSRSPFIGISLEIRADLIDDHVNLKFDPEYHFIPGLHPSLADINNKPASGTDPDKIKIAKRAVTARLSAGQTLCTDLGEIEPGKFLQIFTTVEPLDATGRPVDSFKNGKLFPDLRPNDLPPSLVKGNLRLNAVFVEIPLKTQRPPGEGLVIGLTPSDPKVAAAIRKTSGAKVRKLKTVEMPLNERRVPWQEFPALSVSAIASKDFKLITIASHAVGDGVGEFPNVWEEMPAGSVMNFGIRTKDPMVERRLLITIEAVK